MHLETFVEVRIIGNVASGPQEACIVSKGIVVGALSVQEIPSSLKMLIGLRVC